MNEVTEDMHRRASLLMPGLQIDCAAIVMYGDRGCGVRAFTVYHCDVVVHDVEIAGRGATPSEAILNAALKVGCLKDQASELRAIVAGRN